MLRNALPSAFMDDLAGTRGALVGSKQKEAERDRLDHLVAIVAGDGLFLVAGGPSAVKDELEGLAQRRADAYMATLKGHPTASLTGQFDAWLMVIVRAMAPVGPPSSIPMMQVVREKVTLEVGARGLRSLFSSKPSERDVARVRRYGSLAVRSLRAVFAADGPIDAEDRLSIAAVVAALGLPEDEATALVNEAPMSPETLDVHSSDTDHAIARAIVRGMWWAAAADGIDPREERAIAFVAKKLGIGESEIEDSRREAQEYLETQSKVGAAAVDGVRFVLSDRSPGLGVRLPALVGNMMIPKRWREEALAAVGQGAPITLAGRHTGLAAKDRCTVLSVVWAAALMDNPTTARAALLRARWERVAADIGEDDPAPRDIVDRWTAETVTRAARTFQ